MKEVVESIEYLYQYRSSDGVLHLTGDYEEADRVLHQGIPVYGEMIRNKQKGGDS
jgi:hypothetical protein